jgi:hypothetical protein
VVYVNEFKITGKITANEISAGELIRKDDITEELWTRGLR